MKIANQPKHIAIIMDGNRRWAKKRGLPIAFGHRKVAEEIIEELADYCLIHQIKYLTLWAFSTQNWQRDPQEVELLMSLFREYLANKIDKLQQKGIKLKVIGDISLFADDIQQLVKKGLKQTAKNTKLVLTLGLNYGGRDELMRAVNQIKSQQALNKPVSEKMFSQHLDTNQIPDPDLIIRPGGEKRLSGFMPWQSVYSELYFSDVLMPDFGALGLEKAIEDYQHRQRRFGK